MQESDNYTLICLRNKLTNLLYKKEKPQITFSGLCTESYYWPLHIKLEFSYIYDKNITKWPLYSGYENFPVTISSAYNPRRLFYSLDNLWEPEKNPKKSYTPEEISIYISNRYKLISYLIQCIDKAHENLLRKD